MTTDQSGQATRMVSSASPRVAPPASGGDPAAITAELPAVGGTLRRGPNRGPAIHAGRRMPAPVALRIFVWLLVLVFAVALAGSIVAKVRPDDLSVLRKVQLNPPSANSSSTSSSSLGHGSDRSLGTSTFHVSSSNAKAVAYVVPSASYQLVIVVAAPTWISERSPATAASPTFAKVVTPGKQATTISVRGSASITFGKDPTSVTVRSGNKVLGQVSTPRLGVTYTFEPETAG